MVESLWTDERSLLPESPAQAIWWEAWVRRIPPESADDVLGRFQKQAQRDRIPLSEQYVLFPERLVFLARASREQWSRSLPLLNLLAELRKAKEVPTDWVELAPSEQAEFVKDAAARIQAPAQDAPAVCLLDTGVHHEHPLLRKAITPDDVVAVDPDWPPVDHRSHGRGHGRGTERKTLPGRMHGRLC